jgi:hypothetical protein
LNRLCWALAGAWAVEVSEHVGGAALQGAAEGGHFSQPGRHAGADRVDRCAELGFRGAAVGVSVGGDDALVDAPGRFNFDVALVGEHGVQAGVLLVSGQLDAGAQHAADAVERLTGAPAVPAGLLLDSVAAAVQGIAGEVGSAGGAVSASRLVRFTGRPPNRLC